MDRVKNIIEKQYYIAAGKTHLGPYSLEELQRRRLSPDTLIWYENLAQWTKASEIEELKTFVAPMPPPTPSRLEYQKKMENYTEILQRINKNFIKAAKQTVKNVTEMGKRSILPFILLFISLFIVLSQYTEFGNGYSGKKLTVDDDKLSNWEWKDDINDFKYLQSKQIAEQELKESNRTHTFYVNRFPLAKPYCNIGVFVDNNEIWSFLIQISLFWAFVFTIIYLTVSYFRKYKNHNKGNIESK